MSPKRRSGGGSRLVGALNLLAFLPLASRAPLYVRLLAALILDPRVPGSRKALLGLAAAYVASPVDLIPERVPVLGALDDVAVVVLAVELFLDGLPSGLVDEKLAELGIPRSELEGDLKRVRRSVPGPVRAVLGRVPEALDAVAKVIHDTGLEGQIREMAGQRGGTHGRRHTTMEEFPA